MKCDNSASGRVLNKLFDKFFNELCALQNNLCDNKSRVKKDNSDNVTEYDDFFG